MTARESAVLRDALNRLRLAEERAQAAEREVAYLRNRRDLIEPVVIKRWRNRVWVQRKRAEMWRERALRKASR